MPHYRCSGCKRLNCPNYASYGVDCLGKSPAVEYRPTNPVCVTCGIFCANLSAYGFDCLGYRGGIAKSERKEFRRRHYDE